MMLPADAPIAGQRIGASSIRERTGAWIVALLRDEEVVSNPGPEEVLSPGQSVAIVGTPEQRAAFRATMTLNHDLTPQVAEAHGPSPYAPPSAR